MYTHPPERNILSNVHNIFSLFERRARSNAECNTRALAYPNFQEEGHFWVFVVIRPKIKYRDGAYSVLLYGPNIGSACIGTL
jgi:hypothetical protein